MHSLYDVPAPASLNLLLHITGRRADGYHLLQSVFMLIDWQDRCILKNQRRRRHALHIQLPMSRRCQRTT